MKIKRLKKFLTNREYWDWAKQNIPINKDDNLYPNKNLVTFDNDSQKILTDEEVQKFMEDLNNAER